MPAAAQAGSHLRHVVARRCSESDVHGAVVPLGEHHNTWASRTPAKELDSQRSIVRHCPTLAHRAGHLSPKDAILQVQATNRIGEQAYLSQRLLIQRLPGDLAERCSGFHQLQGGTQRRCIDVWMCETSGYRSQFRRGDRPPQAR